MSNRVAVFLTILAIHEGKVTEIANEAGYRPDWEDLSGSSIPTSSGHFTEVMYGNLLFLPKLVKCGIPYTADVDPFDEYEGGSEYCRYTEDGELDFKRIDDSDWDRLSLSTVESLLNSPITLKQYVEQRRKELTILPWENQEEYGLKYAALQLIRPNDN